MKKFNFPIIKPYAWGKELSNVAKVLASGWLTQGPYADRLEKKINAYIGSRFSFLVNSATSGLIAGLEALGLQSGDEVIVPGFFWVQTVSAVVRAYDPCLSCSTHADGSIAMQIDLIGPDGAVLDQLIR